MLMQNIIIITPDTILIKNLLGLKIKNYSYTNEQLKVKKKGVYINQKKIFSTWYTNTNHQKLKAYFSARHTELQPE
jgi:hypothetical protein